jgi:thiamine pyrophosphate-dependent acetolactate synthase large subunit-like protein
MMGGKAVASEFVDTDFAAIARAFGCQGIRVDNPDNLEPALKEAFQSSVPTVIDAITEPNEPFTKIINR